MEIRRKFVLEKFDTYLKLLASRIVREVCVPDLLEVRDPSFEHFDCPDNSGEWRKITTGEYWGSKNGWTDFRAEVTVPAGWKDGIVNLHVEHTVLFSESPVCYALEFAGPEGQVFIDSVRTGAIDREHHKIRCNLEAGKSYDVRAVFFAGRKECRHQLKAFSLQWVDTATEKLYYDIKALLDIVKLMSRTEKTYFNIIDILDRTINAIDFRDVPEITLSSEYQRCTVDEAFYRSVAAAQEIYEHGLAALKGSPDVPVVTVVGHAHIDLAWLWELRHTHHKCVRTFATQCRLLEQYDKWVFNQSSPQAYKWIETDAPDLFAYIRKFIDAGRWDADGAMWCEADTNVLSGESLVRQLLYGKRYFKNKLGVDSRILWLPDVFGYSGALPQLLRLADVDGFVTSKISWSQYNRFPYDTFLWKGIDGTGIPTHFITTPCEGSHILTYNAMMRADEVKGAWDEYRQKSLGVEPLVSYGYGDGGGGPTSEMIENSLRMSELPAIEGFPELRHEKVSELMKRICDKTEDMPVWDGELYLEYHRGTYTTQGWLKRANRKNEIRLHNIEWLSSIAGELYELNKTALAEVWEDLLLCHFHDIIPGSSVAEVYYDEIRPMQNAIADKTDAMITDVTGKIAAAVDTTAYSKPLVLFNTLSWDRNDPVKLADGHWIDRVTVPAGGWTVIEADKPADTAGRSLSVTDDGRKISNRFWDIELDDNGEISVLFDKVNNRSVLESGKSGNCWQVFADRPMAHPAWDIDYYYQENPIAGPELISIKVAENTPVRIAVELIWQMPSCGDVKPSIITQLMAVYDGNPRIDFETKVEWYEHNQLLKVAFPLAVRTTEATCQIQFGHLRRPTHTNTSWDVAKFEVCAQQYVDLAEYGYGSALMNDCKYGYDFDKNIVRLTCIKCPQAPDPYADKGFHEFTYSLLPHAGSFQDAGIERAARELNVPVIVRETEVSGGNLPASYAFVRCDNPAIIIDTVKPAEDIKSATIIRLYESHGSHSDVTLAFAEAVNEVKVVNLLEKTADTNISLACNDNEVTFRIAPFQVVTLQIQ